MTRDDYEFAQKLGRKIKRHRERAKLTKTEAAEKAGMDYKRWHEYETGQREPSASRLYAIAKALGVTANDLKP